MSLRACVAGASFALCSAIAPPLQAQTTPAARDELAAMRAQLEAMNARIGQLERELAEVRAVRGAQGAAAAATSPTASASSEIASAGPKILWKGAPEIEGEGGWSFKPRGRLMFDAGFVDAPDAAGRDDGFGSEARRARLGVEGNIPGGFGYKFELDFAGDAVEAVDALLSYGRGPITITVGQHNNFQSLEELTSSLHTSFIERAAFTDAFGFERRLGASLAYRNGIALVEAGLFADNFGDSGTGNGGADARVVLMPKLATTQLHFGGSLHYTDLHDATATVRYRQRPAVHFTSERFIDTRDIDADSEVGVGVEAAVISGRFHAAAEGFWQRVGRPAAAADPNFFGGYIEAGFFLTEGDTRGYRNGRFDRVRPVKPLGSGGFGSIQANVRYDYLDLESAGIVGGTQNAFQGSLNWKPTAYTMLGLNYAIISYDNAVYALANGDTSYDVHALAVRTQIDF